MLRCGVLLALCACAASHPHGIHAKLRHRGKAAEAEHWLQRQPSFETGTIADDLEDFHDVSFFFPEDTWTDEPSDSSAQRLAYTMYRFAMTGVAKKRKIELFASSFSSAARLKLVTDREGNRYELRFAYNARIEPADLLKYLKKNPKDLRATLKQKHPELQAFAQKIHWSPNYSVHTFTVTNLKYRFPKTEEITPANLVRIFRTFKRSLGEAAVTNFLARSRIVDGHPIQLSPEERDFFADFSSLLAGVIDSGRLTTYEVALMLVSSINVDNLVALDLLQTVPAAPTAQNARKLWDMFGPHAARDYNLGDAPIRVERLVNGCTRENMHSMPHLCKSTSLSPIRGLADIDDDETKYQTDLSSRTWREEYTSLVKDIQGGAAFNLNENFLASHEVVLWQVVIEQLRI